MTAKELERRMVFARQRAAQVWCEESTRNIEMDSVLAEEFAKVLVTEMYSPNLGCATTRMLLDEIAARCGDLDYTTLNGD